MSVLGKQVVYTEKKAIKEKNDCTVRALATALEIDYFQAYAMMLTVGRKGRKGSNGLFEIMKIYGKNHPRPNMTVENFVRLVLSSCGGNWIVQVRGHVFAVVNGVIHDEYPEWNKNRHVIQAWKVK